MSEIPEVIEALVKEGKVELALQDRRQRAAEEVKIGQWRKAWEALDEAVREALPEALRPYMRSLARVDEDGDPLEEPDAYSYPVFFDIPGLAPLATFVRDFGNGEVGDWCQVNGKVGRYGEERTYSVAFPYNDYEFGIGWSWNDGVSADDLHVALAKAVEGMERYEEMQRKDEEKAKLSEDPVYEDCEEEPGERFMGELKGLIRSVVVDELAAGSL